MQSLNTVTLIGNVGKDPEMRYTTSGDPIANFSIATSESWTTKEGEKKERTEWHRVEVFGPLAQVVRDYVKKGQALFLQGQIRYDEFVDKEQVRRNITKISLNQFNSRLIMLSKKDTGTLEKELLGDRDTAPIENVA